MAAPWEKYAAEQGPWAKYSEQPPAEAPAQPASPANEPFPVKLGRQVANAAAGAVRGAGSIGATLLTPLDAAARAVGVENSIIGRKDRRQAMDAALAGLGADTDSVAYGAGKLGAEVAGTMGVGGTLAKGLTMIPGVAATAPAVQAIQTAGMRAGGLKGAEALAVRSAGGAITGGASAGLVNPEDAGTGAAISAVLPTGLKAAGYAGQKVAEGVKGSVKHGLGLATGVGAEPLAQAFRAGKAGNQEFVDNMRGNAVITDVLDRAKQGLAAMRADRAAQYRSGMVPIKGDKSVLSLGDIDAALTKAADVATFKGQVKSQSAADALSRMRAAVDEWRQLDPAQFHTPEGLDALKQKLGDILEGLPFENKQARLAAGQVYNAAKQTIETQAPSYAKVMRDYSLSTETIREIERALSLGDKAAKDTAMRKLQSLMRNNVQTNYGNRLSLANTLEQQGGVELLPSIAGQAVNSWTPRSLAGQAGGAFTAYSALSNPLMAAALPFQSPRLVGEALYGAGRLAGGVQSGANALMTPALQGGAANALAFDPAMVAQFGYRAAPLVGSGR